MWTHAALGALLLLAATGFGQEPSKAKHTCESFGHALFGSVVCAPGDADGDGVPDLIVADPCWEKDKGTARAWLVSGKTMRVLFDRVIEACGEDTRLSIRGTEDANGDGTKDWLLSSSWFGPESKPNLVAVSGKDGGILGERDAEVVVTSPPGPSREDMGDLDRDGVHDYAIRDQARVALISGKEGKLIRLIEPPATEGWSDFGAALAAMGDVDGDKLCDIAIGMPDWGVSEGLTRVFSSATGKCLYTVEIDGEDWHSGRQLAALGDIDGDGISELAVATWHMLSHCPGRARVVSGKDGRTLATLLRNGNRLTIRERAPAALPK